MGSVAHVEDERKELVLDVHRLDCFGVRLVDSHKGGVIIQFSSNFSLVVDVKSKQHIDPILMDLKDSILGKFIEAFSQGGYAVLRYQGRFCISGVEDLRRKNLEKANGSRHSIHPGDNKMTWGKYLGGMG